MYGTFWGSNRNDPVVIYFPDTRIISKKMWRNSESELHREDGPAMINYSKTGEIIAKFWCRNNKMSDDKKPSHIEYIYGEKAKKLGYNRIETWYFNDGIYRSKGPSVVYYYDDIVVSECWMVGSNYFNPNGPEIIRYQGNIIIEYHLNASGDEHCENGPAYIEYRKTENGDKIKVAEEFLIRGKYIQGKANRIDYDSQGKKLSETWLIDGCIRHRVNGPARIIYYFNGIKEEWYHHGKLTGERFCSL